MDRATRRFAVTLAAASLVGSTGPGLLAMGMEAFGDSRVAEQPEWPKGLLAAVKSPRLLYSQWVNGNENFFYLGRTESLNEMLNLFSRVAAPVREVVLRPGPGKARTFDGAVLPCDFQLHVPSGIYLHMARKEKGTQVYSKHPTLIVYVERGRIDLDQLRIPVGVTVLGLEDVARRCIEGLQNEDPQVRGHAAYILGELPAVADAVGPLTRLIEDQNSYPRLCAAAALQSLGAKAAAALPALRRALQGKEAREQKGIEEAIAAIEGPGKDAAPPEDLPSVLEQIKAFRAGLKR